MPFQKGQSGNPAGRPVAGKAFADMLRVAVNEAHGDGGTKLRALADRLVAEALAGNVQAIREIADRLDGKATQALEHLGPDGMAPESIVIRIVDPRLMTDTELASIAAGGRS